MKLRGWWAAAKCTARGRESGGIANSPGGRLGQKDRLAVMADIAEGIAALKNSVGRLRAQVRKPNDLAEVNRMSVEIGELNCAYETAKSQSAEELELLTRIAWKTKLMGARMERLMDYSAALRKDLLDVVVKLPQTKGDRATRLKEDVERMLEDQHLHTQESIREGKRWLMQ